MGVCRLLDKGWAREQDLWCWAKDAEREQEGEASRADEEKWEAGQLEQAGKAGWASWAGKGGK